MLACVRVCDPQPFEGSGTLTQEAGRVGLDITLTLLIEAALQLRRPGLTKLQRSGGALQPGTMCKGQDSVQCETTVAHM